MKGWLFLVIAIVGEVIATSALKSSEGFTKLAPSAVVIIGYGIAFYFLSLVLKSIPVGVAYAVWSGLGGHYGMGAFYGAHFAFFSGSWKSPGRRHGDGVRHSESHPFGVEPAYADPAVRWSGLGVVIITGGVASWAKA